MVVFGNNRGKGYPCDGLVVIWAPYGCLALYYGYLGTIYGFFSTDDVCGNWIVLDLIPLVVLF